MPVLPKLGHDETREADAVHHPATAVSLGRQEVNRLGGRQKPEYQRPFGASILLLLGTGLLLRGEEGTAGHVGPAVSTGRGSF